MRQGSRGQIPIALAHQDGASHRIRQSDSDPGRGKGPSVQLHHGAAPQKVHRENTRHCLGEARAPFVRYSCTSAEFKPIFASLQALRITAGRGADLGQQPLKTGPAEEVGVALGVDVGLLVGLALGVGVGVRDGVSVVVGEAVGVAEGLAVGHCGPISRNVPSSARLVFFLHASADSICRGIKATE